MKEVFSAVLNVLAIIGLIAVAAFIIVFLTDLLISIIDGKNGIFFKRSKKEKSDVKELEMGDELAPKQIAQEVKEEPEELKGDVNMDLAESERLALLDQKNTANAEHEELKDRVTALEEKVNDKEDEDDDKELSDEELDRMYAQLIADINKEDEEKDENDEFDLNEDFAEKEEEPEEVKEPETETAPVQEEKEEPAEEPAKEEETVEETPVEPEEDKVSTLEQQIEELKKMLEAQSQEKDDLSKQLEQEQQEKENLAKELENRPEVVAVESVDGISMDELLKQKAELEERLKNANKELKANKKEYIPLARIKKTLEGDEAKLRRREAIVAKKKIMLFGVTNYVVDPEKEKELSEDLDQLEALRLSVEHCQEVMTENKDRYPLLENTNKILKTTVEQIKNDIEVVNQKIAALQAKDGDNVDNADNAGNADNGENAND